jgi:sugar phosphate isomerase/epimerase
MPKFGVSLYSLNQKFNSKEMTPDEGVKWLAETAGAEIIEISPVGYDLMERPELIGRMKAAAGSVPITNYTLSADFLQPTKEKYDAEIVRVKKQVDIGREFGVGFIRFDAVGWTRPREEMTIENYLQDLPKIIEGYETVCAYAKPFGITILNENHGLYVNGADRVRALMTGVKADNFGHLLDVGNYACVDDCCEAAVKTVLPFAKHIHVKDFYVRDADDNPGAGWFATRYGRHLRGAIVGHGDINLKAIMRDIRSAKYDGNITLEFEGMEDCLTGVREGLANARRLYEGV